MKARLGWMIWGLAVLLFFPLGCSDDGDDGNGGGDHTAPVVTIAFPPADTTIIGTVTVFAEATDNIAVSHIEFFTDGLKRHTDSSMPYTYQWDCSAMIDSTTHTAFAKAWDAASNAGTSETLSVLVRSGDFVPPEQTLDLGVTDSTGSSITLSWTAPDDEGPYDRATLYDLRYVRTDIDPLDWESATHATDEPVPGMPGTTETITITGLTWGTHYTFALKSQDQVGNWSEISNVAHATAYQEITTTTFADCPMSPGGDHSHRGFYLTEVPAGQLATVVLYLSADTAGQYVVLLTARADRYDGAVIGTARAVVNLTSNTHDNHATEFRFPLPVIQADSVLAFVMQLVSGPVEDAEPYYAQANCPGGCENSCPIIETNGTSPPLDTFRNFGMGAKILIVGQTKNF